MPIGKIGDKVVVFDNEVGCYTGEIVSVNHYYEKVNGKVTVEEKIGVAQTNSCIINYTDDDISMVHIVGDVVYIYDNEYEVTNIDVENGIISVVSRDEQCKADVDVAECEVMAYNEIVVNHECDSCECDHCEECGIDDEIDEYTDGFVNGFAFGYDAFCEWFLNHSHSYLEQAFSKLDPRGRKSIAEFDIADVLNELVKLTRKEG